MTALTVLRFKSYTVGTTLQRQNAKNLKQIFPEKECRGLCPNFHILVSVSKLYIPTMGLPVLLEEICRLILGIYKSLKDTNVDIGAEAALFPEKEYTVYGIAVAVRVVHDPNSMSLSRGIKKQ